MGQLNDVSFTINDQLVVLLRLSNAFMNIKGLEPIESLELVAHVYNINHGSHSNA